MCFGGWEDVLFAALLTFCRCCSLIWLIVVEICMGLTQSSYVTEGFEWFYFRCFDFFMTRDQLRSSTDPPHDCVNKFLQAR